MTHLMVLIHTLEHNDAPSTNLSAMLEFDDSADIEDCSVCDVYLNADFTELQTASYSLIVPIFVSNQILQQDSQFKPVVLYLKQSRSPPFFVA